MTYEEKMEFHRKYTRDLKAFASDYLHMKKGTFEVCSNKGGPAVSGEITLHGEHIYIQIFNSHRGEEMLIRTCDGRSDYSGHDNQIFSTGFFESVADMAEYINELTYQKFGVNANGEVPLKYIINVNHERYDSESCERIGEPETEKIIMDNIEEVAEYINDNSNTIGFSASPITTNERVYGWFMDTEPNQDMDYFEKGIRKYASFFVGATITDTEELDPSKADTVTYVRPLTETEFTQLVNLVDGLKMHDGVTPNMEP